MKKEPVHLLSDVLAQVTDIREGDTLNFTWQPWVRTAVVGLCEQNGAATIEWRGGETPPHELLKASNLTIEIHRPAAATRLLLSVLRTPAVSPRHKMSPRKLLMASALALAATLLVLFGFLEPKASGSGEKARGDARLSTQELTLAPPSFHRPETPPSSFAVQDVRDRPEPLPSAEAVLSELRDVVVAPWDPPVAVEPDLELCSDGKRSSHVLYRGFCVNLLPRGGGGAWMSDCVDGIFRGARAGAGSVCAARGLAESACDREMCRFQRLSSFVLPEGRGARWDQQQPVRLRQDGQDVEFLSFRNRGLERLHEFHRVCVTIGNGLEILRQPRARAGGRFVQIYRDTAVGSRFKNELPDLVKVKGQYVAGRDLRYRGRDETHGAFRDGQTNETYAQDMLLNVFTVLKNASDVCMVSGESTVGLLLPLTFSDNHGHFFVKLHSLRKIREMIEAEHAARNAGRRVNVVLIVALLTPPTPASLRGLRALYELADMPIAGIISAPDPQRRRETLAALAADKSTAALWNLTGGAIGEVLAARMCFERVVVWENCHGVIGTTLSSHCSTARVPEKQNYSFGIDTGMTASRRALIDTMRRRLMLCYFNTTRDVSIGTDALPLSAPSGVPQEAWAALRRTRPHIYVDMRLLTRRMMFGTGAVGAGEAAHGDDFLRGGVAHAAALGVAARGGHGRVHHCLRCAADQDVDAAPVGRDCGAAAPVAVRLRRAHEGDLLPAHVVVPPRDAARDSEDPRAQGQRIERQRRVQPAGRCFRRRLPHDRKARAVPARGSIPGD
jgi:hypothetical protein